MCMKSTEEGCVLKAQLQEVQTATANLDTRLTQVEHDVAKMRTESQDGFKAINASISNLAHDFGARMNNIDKRLVEEKEKWGNTLRSIVVWTVRLVLLGCAVAMGVTAYKTIFVVN